MTPHVKIRPIQIGPATFGTEVLITFGEQHYCTRLNYAMSDTPASRALQAEQFKKRHYQRIAEDYYGAVQQAAAKALNSHDALIAFAKEGSPILSTLDQPKRPTLRLVK